MKKFIAKYETYNNDCQVTSVEAHSEQHAKSLLPNCRIVYWIRPDTEKAKIYEQKIVSAVINTGL